MSARRRSKPGGMLAGDAPLSSSLCKPPHQATNCMLGHQTDLYRVLHPLQRAQNILSARPSAANMAKAAATRTPLTSMFCIMACSVAMKRPGRTKSGCPLCAGLWGFWRGAAPSQSSQNALRHSAEERAVGLMKASVHPWSRQPHTSPSNCSSAGATSIAAASLGCTQAEGTGAQLPLRSDHKPTTLERGTVLAGCTSHSACVTPAPTC